MFFNSVIFDLDGTLYDYDKCHSFAILEVFKLLSNSLNIEYSEIENGYNNIVYNVRKEVGYVASSHNKFIYFRLLTECLNTNIDPVELNKLYWDSFFKNINLNDGVLDFLIYLKSINIEMYILTDYTVECQYQKIEKLGISKLIKTIISSEEIGIEKPSIKSFLYCLDKMSTNKDKVIMIGNNFDRDIQGAKNIGIYPLWFKKDCMLEINSDMITFGNFNEILDLFKSINLEISNLKKISKFFGQRFDLIQAGGGNISIKLYNLMIIKSSGVALSDINNENGYSIINNDKLKNDVISGNYKSIVDYNIFVNERPSMETYMHSYLKKYTVHIHPIQINNILVRKDYYNIIKSILPYVYIVPYYTPGIDLSSGILDDYNGEDVIFLENHGIIVTSNDVKTIFDKIENIIIECEKFIGCDYKKYKIVNEISDAIGDDNLAFLSEDTQIMNYYSNNDCLTDASFFPDKVIFCGSKFLRINNSLKEEIMSFITENEEIPRVIIFEENVYTVAKSLNKCRDIEQILKSHLMTIGSNNNLSTLPDNECYKLSNLESEKFRKK